MKGQFNKPICAIMISMILLVGTMTLTLPYQEAFAATPVEDCTDDSSFDGERMVMTMDIADGVSCILISHDGVVFDCKGHTIDGTDGTTFGVRVTGNGVTVKNCNITDHRFGIVVSGSDGSKITKNTISSGVSGITVQSGAMNNKVTANTVFGHDGRALNVAVASFNQIDRNDFSDNNVGINLFNADNNSFSGNKIDGSFNENIRLLNGSEDNTFKRNTTNGSLNGDGVSITDAGSTGNTFTGNTANGNFLFGIDDDTVGGTGTGVTDNFYTRNRCSGNTSGNSSPADLCS